MKGSEGPREPVWEVARALGTAELTLSHTLAVGPGDRPSQAQLLKAGLAGHSVLELWLVGCASTSHRMQPGPNFAASAAVTKSESQALESACRPCWSSARSSC